MIQLGNGILVEVDGCSFRFDPKRVLLGETSMISHAHSDHLPSSFKQLSAICSPVTRDFIKARRNKEIGIDSDDRVKELEAGHIVGSRMFLVSGEKKVLYTGDFCTREKANTEAAKPHKCDILITEATYGKPQYIFPDHEEIMSVASDWVRDIVRRDGCAVLFAYPLGKSQELTAYFSDLPLVLHPAIAENNRILRMHGYELAQTEFDAHRTKPPFVYITSGLGKDAPRVQSLRKHGAKTAAFSGWALEKGFRYQSGVDEAFPVSDHCGFDELMEFIRRCSPQNVFMNHGFSKELAMHVRRSLGIQAQPLVARQRTLDHFC
jgi:putative mRNA 3-end processing factor